MKLIPKAKAVRIRIVSGGIEHSTVESLKRAFNYCDLLKIDGAMFKRWLRQDNLYSELASAFENDNGKSVENRAERGLVLARALFKNDADRPIENWDDLVSVWSENEKYYSNIQWVPYSSLTPAVIQKSQVLSLIVKRYPELFRHLLNKADSPGISFFLEHADSPVREEARRIIDSQNRERREQRINNLQKIEDALSQGDETALVKNRFRHFGDITFEGKTVFDGLSREVAVWIRNNEYGNSYEPSFKDVSYYTRDSLTFAKVACGIVHDYYRCGVQTSFFWSASGRLTYHSELLPSSSTLPFFRFVLLATMMFCLDYDLGGRELFGKLAKEVGLLNATNIDYVKMNSNVIFEGITKQTCNLLFEHDWREHSVDFKNTLIAVIKEYFSLK